MFALVVSSRFVFMNEEVAINCKLGVFGEACGEVKNNQYGGYL